MRGSPEPIAVPAVGLAPDIPDFINPLIVRELRQALRSRLVVALFMVSLALFVVVAAGASLILGVTELARGDVAAQGSGLYVCMVFLGVLSTFAFTGIPLYAAVRLAAERGGEHRDLLYVTTLSPSSLILGKLGSAGAILALLVAACIPFLGFTYLLRGVDLPAMYAALFMTVLAVVVRTQWALLWVCLPIPRALTIIGLIWFGLNGLGSAMVPVAYLAPGPFGAATGPGADPGGILTPATGFAVATGIALYALTVALVSPPLSNRARHLRPRFTLAVLLHLACVHWTIHLGSGLDGVAYPAFQLLMVMVLAALLVCSGPEAPNERIRHGIPASRVRRAATFFLTSGFASGLLWWTALALAVALGLVPLADSGLVPAPSQALILDALGVGQVSFQPPQVATALALGLAYGLVARWIARHLPAPWLPRNGMWLMGLFLMLAVASGQGVILAVHLSRYRQVPAIFHGNPVAILFVEFAPSYAVSAAAMVMLGLALNASALARGIRDFRPFATPPPLSRT